MSGLEPSGPSERRWKIRPCGHCNSHHTYAVGHTAVKCQSCNQTTDSLPIEVVPASPGGDEETCDHMAEVLPDGRCSECGCVSSLIPPGGDEVVPDEDCPRCEGHGNADWNEPDGDEMGCVRCNGTGKVPAASLLPGGDEVEALTPAEAKCARDALHGAMMTVQGLKPEVRESYALIEQTYLKLDRLSPPQTTEEER